MYIHYFIILTRTGAAIAVLESPVTSQKVHGRRVLSAQFITSNGGRKRNSIYPNIKHSLTSLLI